MGTVYVVKPDAIADDRGRLRIVAESGDDYLYPADYFLPVELSRSAKDALTAASKSRLLSEAQNGRFGRLSFFVFFVVP